MRELVPDRDEEDDETLRDRLDEALGMAEDSGRAIRTLDAMLGEPQTLIPIDTFGDVLYAIIKEDTVVTVLPQGHGEEILQRGQAMEQRVASGHASVRPVEREEERWEGPRRRWRKEAPQPVVIERIVRGGNGNGGEGTEDGDDAGLNAVEEAPRPSIAAPAPNASKVLQLREPARPEGPIAKALLDALEAGRRRAAVVALAETLRGREHEAALLPLWNELAEEGVPAALTVGDLIEAARLV